MVAEMVIAVANGNVECHPAIKLAQVVIHVAAVLKNEVHDVQIAITCLGITTTSQSQQGHSRCEMLSSSIGCPVETL